MIFYAVNAVVFFLCGYFHTNIVAFVKPYWDKLWAKLNNTPAPPKT